MTPNTAADEIGIQVGDVILSFDGVRIDDDDHLVNQVKLTPIGKSVPVVVLRDGMTVEFKACLCRPQTGLKSRSSIQQTASRTASPLVRDVAAERQRLPDAIDHFGAVHMHGHVHVGTPPGMKPPVKHGGPQRQIRHASRRRQPSRRTRTAPGRARKPAPRHRAGKRSPAPVVGGRHGK